LVERSQAIKIPKLGYQLVGSKKFQQFLYETDTIEKFFANDQSVPDRLRETFVKQYSFGKEKNNSDLIDMMKNNYENVILKPQREGGGNNIYGEDIKYDFVLVNGK
jgi:glutathione synthase